MERVFSVRARAMGSHVSEASADTAAQPPASSDGCSVDFFSTFIQESPDPSLVHQVSPLVAVKTSSIPPKDTVVDTVLGYEEAVVAESNKTGSGAGFGTGSSGELSAALVRVAALESDVTSLNVAVRELEEALTKANTEKSRIEELYQSQQCELLAVTCQ